MTDYENAIIYTDQPPTVFKGRAVPRDNLWSPSREIDSANDLVADRGSRTASMPEAEEMVSKWSG